ncbi:hypothetical protein A2856_00140 [Candidatus Uhrbacteria bacterium RIFCSPHIGHO2_01_FULL_63_20]|uniref:Uncharacterized protein n=1 Tax=Candidatus Uhrbacteria bacterium RIFCSPHIGHO2_01_FULL_63_20 TaxID=1802385 RepID=A0A1F7TLP7_9BACT|nr:MAG: hypothetical protein A2856_00140 [Candidatus Uhrbacteria bacterium RIFCSPHIGHO2_01_FULL_63_20]
MGTQDPSVIDSLFLMLANFLAWITGLVNSITAALLQFTIMIMSYNGFTDSPVVSAGWAIVRDTVNMFFVVVLIVIALFTIFGSHRFDWRQQVPRLLLFAIVINFSKTICGILIDAGQVIMLTFANALQAVMAGNFLQLFAISSMNVSQDSTLQTFDLFLGSAAALVASVWVFVTVLILLAILVWRVVWLWVLITIAPLTWFIGGARGVTSSHAYEDWWKQFTCAVAVGPILTFFLWLTLTVAGAGNLAASKGLEKFSTAEKVGDIPIELFEPVHLMTFVIAMAMIYAGFQAASEFCGGASGMVSGLLKKGEGAGKAVALGLGGLGLAGAAKGGRLALKGGGKAAGAVAGRVGGSDLIQNRRQAQLEALRTKAATQASPLDRAKTLAKAEALQGKITESAKTAAAPFGDFSKEAKTAALLAMGEKMKKGEQLSGREKQQGQALYAELVGDKDARKALDQAGTFSTLHDGLGGKEMEAKFKGDKDLSGNLKQLKALRPDVTKDFSSITSVEDLKAMDERAFGTIGSDEAAKKQFEDQLKGLDSGFAKEDGTRQSLYEAFVQGRAGGKKFDAFDKGLSGLFSKMSPDELAKQDIKELAPHVTAEMLNKPGGEKIAQKILKSEIPEIRAKLDDRPVYEAAMKGIGFDVKSNAITNPADFEKFVKENPLALGNFKPETMSAGTSGAITTALGKDGLNKILTKYKKGSAEERARLESALGNARTAVLNAGTEEARGLSKWFDAEAGRARGSGAPGGTSGVEGRLAELTAQDDALAREAQTLNEDLNRLTAQIQQEQTKEGLADVDMLDRWRNDQAAARARIREASTRRDALREELENVRAVANEQRVAQSVKEAEDRSRGGTSA